MKNQFKTRVTKSIRGELTLESTLMLTPTKELLIYTKKGNGKTIYSQASCSELEDSGGGWVSKTHKLFEDFNIQIQKIPCARVTEKQLQIAHDKIDFADIYTQAMHFYKLWPFSGGNDGTFN